MKRTLTDNVIGLKFEFIQDDGCDYYTVYKYRKEKTDWKYIIGYYHQTKETIWKLFKIKL